jgi:hypothetical protein
MSLTVVGFAYNYKTAGQAPSCATRGPEKQARRSGGIGA